MLGKKIKVVFLVIHRSVWKVDTVFRRMQNDDLFDPEILVCPNIKASSTELEAELESTYNFFESKNYKVSKSRKANGEWLRLDELAPHIIFFTNPYKLTLTEYYESAFKNYLSCYVPYYFMATEHAGKLSDLLNTRMLNAMWRIYWPHKYVYDEYAKWSTCKGKNGRLSGYPAVERLYDHPRTHRELERSVWRKVGDTKKRIIYAPHHSIENSAKSLSSFLIFGKLLRDISARYKNEIQWAFKPHPLLKEKLYNHPDWGQRKTEEYYSYWENNDNSQVELGEYEKLFIESDALIHDCSSFIVEYAFLEKPALFLKKTELSEDNFLNEFGKIAFKSHQIAESEEEVISFILELLEPTQISRKFCQKDFDSYTSEFYSNNSPSREIINDIKSALANRKAINYE
ncbi:CDP-glycerol glycerophosphotransferase family protein [Pseudidiomarina taiwanensis]|nr:CDP-glycerol glycerophosphotransferase family protein [Pseudidiomarina taiwanensis]